jgi:hypothetical protein
MSKEFIKQLREAVAFAFNNEEAFIQRFFKGFDEIQSFYMSGSICRIEFENSETAATISTQEYLEWMEEIQITPTTGAER